MLTRRSSSILEAADLPGMAHSEMNAGLLLPPVFSGILVPLPCQSDFLSTWPSANLTPKSRLLKDAHRPNAGRPLYRRRGDVSYRAVKPDFLPYDHFSTVDREVFSFFSRPGSPAREPSHNVSAVGARFPESCRLSLPHTGAHQVWPSSS